MTNRNRLWTPAAALCALALVGGCAGTQRQPSDRVTERDRTKKGAAIGAAVGAVVGILGEGEADDILAGAAVGAALGAGVGAYMDRQQERLAQIPGTTVERLEDGILLLHFDSDVLFEIDSADLSDESSRTLNEVTQVLTEYKKTAIVAQGHTDSTGSDDHNQKLSERRADAVAYYLMRGGVDSNRVAVVGYGESHPVADNATAEGRRKNRRVDLLLKAPAR